MPPPALSALRMSTESSREPGEESTVGQDGKHGHSLVSVQDGTLQPPTCTLACCHMHPLLPAAVKDAFWVSSVFSV